jgi:glycosyltransferase involved in cell wall biosynthesis
MVHQFEGELLLTLRSYLPRSPVLVSSTDEAPALGLENYPTYPAHRNKSPLRRAFRLALDRWRARRVDCLIPFTRWAAELYRKVERVSDEKIIPIHVGLDLTLWAFRDRSRPDHEAPKILFVGADFQRKGGDLLLEVFRKGFASSTELHLVTGHTPSDLPSNVFLHQDLVPNDERLVALYRSCTMLVMPTTADLAPWVFIEAMATGCPVIGTNVGAISEIIDDGVTGFVIPVGDAEALNVRMHHLLDHPNIAREMGRQGRLKVEREFDASRNVPKILKAMKLTVERRKRLGTAARA